MTSAHILYIPTIFLLGFLSGSLVGKGSNSSDKASKQFGISGRALLGSLLIVVIVFVGTHFFEIPRSSKAVTKALNGLEIFDKKPSYTSEGVYSRMEMFPEYGRDIYKQFTYTIDVLFPITLFAFVFLLARFALNKAIVPRPFGIFITALPILWLSMDLVENAIIFRLLDNFPVTNHALAGSLGFVTITKFTLLLLSILAPTALITLRNLRRRVSTNA
jgi:hypothetical protein